jgi:ankyrin repeat protein
MTKSLNGGGGNFSSNRKQIQEELLDIFSKKFDKKSITLIKELIKRGANVNAKITTDHDLTFLSLAIAKNNYEIVELLIDNGADVNIILATSTRQGQVFTVTPLSLAVQKNNFKIVELLIKNGADVNMVNVNVYNQEYTALSIAVEIDKIEIVELLIENGADINMNNIVSPQSPLYLAVCKNHTNISIFLIKKGANINFNGRLNPLFCAINNNNLDIFKELLKSPTINNKSFSGEIFNYIRDNERITNQFKEAYVDGYRQLKRREAKPEIEFIRNLDFVSQRINIDYTGIRDALKIHGVSELKRKTIPAIHDSIEKKVEAFRIRLLKIEGPHRPESQKLIKSRSVTLSKSS